MPKRPIYIVQPCYDGQRYVVVGPSGFAKISPNFIEACALATRMNEQHERTQAAASDLIARHFLRSVPKDAQP